MCLSLWENSLSPLSSCSYPFSGKSSGGRRQSSLAAEARSPVGNCWVGTEGTCAFRPVCDLGCSSSEFGSWSRPFTLKVPLGHSLSSSSVLFLSVSSGSGDGADLPGVIAGDGAAHAQNIPGQRPPRQNPEWALLLLSRDFGSVHRAQRRVCRTGRWWAGSHKSLCERPVVSPGNGSRQKPWLVKGCLDLISEGSSSEAVSNRSGPGGSSKLHHSLLAGIPGGYDAGISRCSTATMAQAAGRSVSPVLLRFMR